MPDSEDYRLPVTDVKDASSMMKDRLNRSSSNSAGQMAMDHEAASRRASYQMLKDRQRGQ